MEIRFVDRVEELSKLMAYAEKGFYPILYLYSPEGSGKTRLLKEFYRAVGDRDDFLVVYVDAQSVEDLKKAVYAPPQLLQLVVDVAKEFAGSAGRIAALAILQAIRMLKKVFIRNKHVVVLVDDVAKPLGLDMIEIYSKNMLNLLEITRF
ncbi:MAG: ATP-binding protein [Ignisphaera sp.]